MAGQEDQYRLYYSIGEVAKIVGVEPSTLRYWESKFTQAQPRRSTRGRRQYTKEDIQTFQQIYHLLREEGISIEHAQTRLKYLGNAENNRIQAIAKLHRVKQLLNELKDLL